MENENRRMASVIRIGDRRKTIEREMMCIKCGNRWMMPDTKFMPLKEIPCINCGKTGWVILTGETTEWCEW